MNLCIDKIISQDSINMNLTGYDESKSRCDAYVICSIHAVSNSKWNRSQNEKEKDYPFPGRGEDAQLWGQDNISQLYHSGVGKEVPAGGNIANKFHAVEEKN